MVNSTGRNKALETKRIDQKSASIPVGLRDRATATLLGLATGDAAGGTQEFTPRNRIRPITDMVGGGPHHLTPGHWTDGHLHGALPGLTASSRTATTPETRWSATSDVGRTAT